MKRIDEDIKNNNFSNLYLITGSQSYLIRQYKNKLIKALIPSLDNMNFTSFVGNEDKKGFESGLEDYANKIIDTANTLPLFSDKRVILVENSGLLKKSVDNLCKFFEDIPDTSFLVFVEKTIDKRSRTYKAIDKNGIVESLDMPSQNDISRWILSRLKSYDISMTKSSFNLFMTMMADGDMEYIDKELEKLISYAYNKKTINDEDIKAITSPVFNLKIFDFIDSLAIKDKSRALKLYRDILFIEESPLKVLSLISRQIRQIYDVCELNESNKPTSTIASIIGIPEFVVKKNLKTLRIYNKNSLRKAIEDIAKTEWEIKSGQINEQIGVELFIHSCLVK